MWLGGGSTKEDVPRREAERLDLPEDQSTLLSKLLKKPMTEGKPRLFGNGWEMAGSERPEGNSESSLF